VSHLCIGFVTICQDLIRKAEQNVSDYGQYKESRDRCIELLSTANEKFSVCRQVSDNNEENLHQQLVELQVCIL
jgi:hypothetical protein